MGAPTNVVGKWHRFGGISEIKFEALVRHIIGNVWEAVGKKAMKL